MIVQNVLMSAGVAGMLVTMVWSIRAKVVPLRARRWGMISSGLGFVALYAGFVIADVLSSPRSERTGTGYVYAVTDTHRQTQYWLAFDAPGQPRQFFTISTPVYRAVRRGDTLRLRFRTWSEELDHISIPSRGFTWDEREDGGMLAAHAFILLPVLLALALTLSRAKKEAIAPSGEELRANS